MDQVFFKCYWKDFARCRVQPRRVAEEHFVKRETVLHFTLDVKFSCCFYSLVILHVLCVCEMMRLVLVNDILSYLNLRNDKRN